MKEKKSILHYGATPQIFRNAEELRNNMTEAEKILWEALRNKQLDGLKFRRQHPISRYVLDFFCFKAKLGIELDGKYHEDKPQQFYDADRTQNLTNEDIKIIRFSIQEIFDNLEMVLNTIKEECKARLAPSP